MSQQKQVSVSRVIQQNCSSDLQQALGLFGNINQDGSLPIVLTPNSRPFGKAWITIPSGVTAVVTSKGKDVGDIAPGTHFAPPYWRVMYIVPNQACTYNYDVVSSPTQDNVMVEVDVTLVFRISDARTFCYSLGAQKFDEMLKAVCEEAIRSMVRIVDHKDVYELRGSGAADELLNVVNEKFKTFGITFVNSTITNVLLPEDVAESLQQITILNQKMNEEEKTHEFNLKKIKDDHEMKLQDLKLQMQRKLQDLEAEKQRIEIEMDVKRAEANKQKELAIIKAEQNASVAIKEIEAELENEKIQAETQKEFIIKEAQRTSNKKKLEVEAKCQRDILQSEAQLQQQIKDSEALKLQAEAEAQAASGLSAIREFELQTILNQNLSNLARKNRILINGEDGDHLIHSLSNFNN
eukprot:TRINITY_DN1828_c0_g1_i3.p1 TRINITY_DN1828_c0_g1~~TRINITY_DN1828_c0_g1_i3.p1  ORF type:complete len:409 (+),score=175.71 TRINITY_DN1828_c0_g1_i3:113-1339(+)